MTKELQLSWDKLIINIKNKKKSEEESSYRLQISKKMEYISDILGRDIHDIDFESFSLNDLFDFQSMLYAYRSDEDVFTIEEISEQNYGNIYYEIERIPFAINNILRSKSKVYLSDQEDDFI